MRRKLNLLRERDARHRNEVGDEDGRDRAVAGVFVRGGSVSSKSSTSDSDDGSQSDSVEDNGRASEPVVADLHSSRDRAVLAKRVEREQAAREVVRYRNRQRVMVLCSRGVSTRYRHLMEDVRALLPHSRKEVKHDTKKRLFEINEICEAKSCNGCVFFEVRKRQDLYLWVTRAPNGPSLKFLVSNVHTMDELKLPGNALHGSRPIVAFDESFGADRVPAHLALVREVLATTFGTPRGHPKSKPFVDRVVHFAYLDGCVWIRNYQIVDDSVDRREVKKAASLGQELSSLVEIGPRAVLTLVKILEGGFGGRVLYENVDWVAPNEERARVKRAEGLKYESRKRAQTESARRRAEVENSVPEDPLGDVFQ